MTIKQKSANDVELFELAARLRRIPWTARDCDRAAELLEQQAGLVSNNEQKVLNRIEQALVNHQRNNQIFRAFEAMYKGNKPDTFLHMLGRSYFYANQTERERLIAAFPDMIEEWSGSADAERYIDDGR